MMENIRMLFLVFTVYSFLGWLVESIVCSVPEKKFVNRGFLNGPFCPIYGVGGVLVLQILTPFRDNVLLLFLASVVITTLVEYCTGFALEKLFHTKYWDYSERRFNLQGRICLGNSLAFGVMCVVCIYSVHPRLLRLLGMIPENLLLIIAAVLMLYFISDTVLTVNAVWQLNGKLNELQLVLNEIKQRASLATTETIETIRLAVANRVDEETKQRVGALFEKLDKLEETSKLMQRRLLSAFPTMKSIQNNESLQHMKQAIAERAKSIRKK